jgi:hypothetical protein
VKESGLDLLAFRLNDLFVLLSVGTGACAIEGQGSFELLILLLLFSHLGRSSTCFILISGFNFDHIFSWEPKIVV